jgi:hypothetical protein
MRISQRSSDITAHLPPDSRRARPDSRFFPGLAGLGTLAYEALNRIGFFAYVLVLK